MLEALSMAYRLIPTCEFIQARVPDVN